MDRVRRLGHQADDTEQNKIDGLCKALKTYFLHLGGLQQKAGVHQTNHSPNPIVFEGDNIDWERGQGTVEASAEETHNVSNQSYEAVSIEKHVICLPSNSNTGGRFLAEELDLHLEQADKHLSQPRELIADKSFQYSALICTGNQPAVRTRARNVLYEMNAKIGLHTRMYNRVRCRLVMLGADERTLTQYRLLQTEDIAASMAILDFNQPGSSTAIKLSWIWHSVCTCLEPTKDVPALDASTLLECEAIIPFIFSHTTNNLSV